MLITYDFRSTSFMRPVNTQDFKGVHNEFYSIFFVYKKCFYKKLKVYNVIIILEILDDEVKREKSKF